MSIDRLQEKIRKTKNPSVLDLDITRENIPPHLLVQEGSFFSAYNRFCVEIMEGLRGVIPAVKFNFAAFALLGTEGLVSLSRVLDYGKRLGYYVILEMPEALSAQRSNANAQLIFDESCIWPFDGLLISGYIGTDAIKPYAERVLHGDKSLFVAVRTANRSAAEIQDLLTGGRNVYDAMADIVNRFANMPVTKSGYDCVAMVGPASSASILHKLRQKYKNLFLLVDGYDYPNANAKNCAEAMDQFGHGAAICSGTQIAAAWKIAENDGTEYVADAIEAAERMKKNLGRYISVL